MPWWRRNCCNLFRRDATTATRARLQETENLSLTGFPRSPAAGATDRGGGNRRPRRQFTDGIWSRLVLPLPEEREKRSNLFSYVRLTPCWKFRLRASPAVPPRSRPEPFFYPGAKNEPVRPPKSRFAQDLVKNTSGDPGRDPRTWAAGAPALFSSRERNARRPKISMST